MGRSIVRHRKEQRSRRRNPSRYASTDKPLDQSEELRTGASATPTGRRARRRIDKTTTSRTGPTTSSLPRDYADVLGSIKARIQKERLRTVLAANSAMVLLYWDIGRMILGRQQDSGWGAKIIDRLAIDLRHTYPDMKGFSPRNLKYMRAFAAAWPDRAIVQAPLAQITWYHNHSGTSLPNRCRRHTQGIDSETLVMAEPPLDCRRNCGLSICCTGPRRRPLGGGRQS